MRTKLTVLILISVALLANIALADANVSVGIQTTGDVLLDTDVNTTGDVEVWIDGTNIGDELSQTQEELSQTQSLVNGIPGEMMGPEHIAMYIQEAVNWLNGKVVNSDVAKIIGYALDSYFASDYDIQVIVNKINELEMRLQVLERTMEKIAPEEFCEEKIWALKEYNLTYVKCGINSTVYTSTDPEEFGGFDLVGYNSNPCFEEWECTGWSECEDGLQERTCHDKNECGTNKNKPNENRGCVLIEQPVLVEENLETGEGITGAFLGVTRNYGLAATYVLVVVLVTLTAFNVKIYSDLRKKIKRR